MGRKRKRGPAPDDVKEEQPEAVRKYAHQHTNATPTGLGSSVTAAPGRLAAGPLTDLCCCQPVAKWAPPAAARSSVISNAAAAVELELLRASALDQLRRSLASLCAKSGLRNVPLLAFERWRFAAKWAEDEPAAVVTPPCSTADTGTGRNSSGSSSSSKSSKPDPVLPFSTAAAAAEPGLQQDLQRAGLTEAAAASAASKLAQASAAVAEGIQKRRHQLVSGKSPCCPEVAVAFHRHSVDFTCSGRFAKVSRAAYGKLARLYRLHWLSSCQPGTTVGLALAEAQALAGALQANAAAAGAAAAGTADMQETQACISSVVTHGGDGDAQVDAERGDEDDADEDDDGIDDLSVTADAGSRAAVCAEALIAELEQQQQQQPGAASTRAEFHQRLFALLLRYKSIQGHGFQAAAGPQVFQVLRSSLSVGHECFASPLNCHFQRYCSAFPDVDAPFGSCGSFFRVPFKHGSYEANPPFVPALLTATAVRVLELLAAAEAAGGALSFTVLLPGWTEVAGWQLLQDSPFLRHSLLVAAADHGYCDGAAHQRKDPYRASPFDTALLFLQTRAAATKWPVSARLLQDLQAAMAACLPSAAATERQRKQRGLADLELRGLGVPVQRTAAGAQPHAEQEVAESGHAATAGEGLARHSDAEGAGAAAAAPAAGPSSGVCSSVNREPTSLLEKSSSISKQSQQQQQQQQQKMKRKKKKKDRKVADMAM